MSKTVSVYFSGDEEQIHDDMLSLQVKPKWGGKVSPYLIDLVRRDLAGEGPKVERRDDIVVQLTRLFHPTLEKEMSAALAGHDQSRILARMLEGLAEAVKRNGEFNPEAPFHLYNSREQLMAKGGDVFLRALATYTEELENQLHPTAAEHPATFGASPVSEAAAEAERRQAAAGSQDRKTTRRPKSGPSGFTKK